MENNTTIIDAFKNSEIASRMSDNTYLFKLAGENIWYVVDGQGHTLVRTRPDGTNEFATVDFYDMVGEPYNFQSGFFKDGILVMKFICKHNGQDIDNYYEISPSGYTFNTTKTRGSQYSKLGVNYRTETMPTSMVSKRPLAIQHVDCKSIHTQEYLDVIYDVAVHTLMQGYDKFKKEHPRKTPRSTEKSYATAAKNIMKRYEFIKSSIERRTLKTDNKNSSTQTTNQPE